MCQSIALAVRRTNLVRLSHTTSGCYQRGRPSAPTATAEGVASAIRPRLQKILHQICGKRPLDQRTPIAGSARKALVRLECGLVTISDASSKNRILTLSGLLPGMVRKLMEIRESAMSVWRDARKKIGKWPSEAWSICKRSSATHS